MRARACVCVCQEARLAMERRATDEARAAVEAKVRAKTEALHSLTPAHTRATPPCTP